MKSAVSFVQHLHSQGTLPFSICVYILVNRNLDSPTHPNPGDTTINLNDVIPPQCGHFPACLPQGCHATKAVALIMKTAFVGGRGVVSSMCVRSLLLLMQYLILHRLQRCGQRRACFLQLLLDQEVHAEVGGCRRWGRDPASWRPAIDGHAPDGGARGLYRWRGRAGSGRGLGCLRRRWCLGGVGALRGRTERLGVGRAGDVGRGKGGGRAGLPGQQRMLLDWSWGRGRALAGGAGHGVDELGWFGGSGRGHRLGGDRRGYLLSLH